MGLGGGGYTGGAGGKVAQTMSLMRGATLGGKNKYHAKHATGHKASLGGGRPKMTLKGAGGPKPTGGPKMTYTAPKLPKLETTATPPPELTGYAEGYGQINEAMKGRVAELRDKGGAFLEEAGRQGRQSVEARIEEARQRAAEEGVPFDEKAAMREALQAETGARSEGLARAEDKIDAALGAQASAYQGGLPVVQAPHQMALAQQAQNLEQQMAAMNYALQKEGLGIEKAAQAQQMQMAWMSLLGSMLNAPYA